MAKKHSWLKGKDKKSILVRNYLWILLLVSVVVFAIAASVYFVSVSSQKYSGPVETLKIGSVSEFSLLLNVAQRQGFFEQNGINAEISKYPTGSAAFEGLNKSEVDIAAASDFVGVRNSLQGKPFKIITAILDTSNLFQFVGRRDQGVNSPADIADKRVGITEGTAGEYFLDAFETLNEIPEGSVTAVNGEPPALTEKTASGDVAATLTARFQVYTIANQLGAENAVVFGAQSNADVYQLLYANDQLVQQNPALINRFVKALVQAENYIDKNPQEVRTVLKEDLQRPDDYINGVIDDYNFDLSLKQSMVIGMEDQARWFINEKGLATEVPNYLDYIYFNALQTTKPEAVSIIRL